MVEAWRRLEEPSMWLVMRPTEKTPPPAEGVLTIASGSDPVVGRAGSGGLHQAWTDSVPRLTLGI